MVDVWLINDLNIALPREELDMLFESQDKDQNGKLSWQEFSGQESKNEKAFKLMDADHNGKISKNVSLIFCPKREDFVIFSCAGVQESLPPPDKGAG